MQACKRGLSKNCVKQMSVKEGLKRRAGCIYFYRTRLPIHLLQDLSNSCATTSYCGPLTERKPPTRAKCQWQPQESVVKKGSWVSSTSIGNEPHIFADTTRFIVRRATSILKYSCSYWACSYWACSVKLWLHGIPQGRHEWINGSVASTLNSYKWALSPYPF